MEFDYAKEPGRRLMHRGLVTEGAALVSIVTPYYNAGRCFEQTYNSVMNQTFSWYEWIIVDDGSTDGESLEVLKQLSGRDGRIQVIHQANGGQSAARNAGIRASGTGIIVPLDADDLIEPTFLEVLYFALEKHPEAAWAYTDSVGFGAQEYLWKKPFSAEQMKEENLLVCTAAIRKEWLEKVGGYEVSEYRYDEDWHLWLRLLSAGAYPVHLSGNLFWYRRSAGGMQQTVQRDNALRRQSQEKIREAARNVDTSIIAVEYPRSKGPGGYRAPKVSEWTGKVFAGHDKVHVLILLPWMEMGGADLFNLDVCARLDKDRFEVGIITTQASENSWQQRFGEYAADIFNLPEFLDTEDWAEFISYYVKSREVDVLFLSNSYYGYYLVPWLRKEFPELAIIDYVHMEEWYWRSGGFARTSGAMGEILEKTYVCNERTRRVLIEDFGRAPEGVETLYIGVDAEKYDESKVKPGQAKAMLGIAQARPMILFPCRMHPQKRPFMMLAIAKALRQRIPDVAFAAVGDGPQLEELKDTAKREGLEQTVYFAGRQNDMRPWYRDAALTLICSLKEGLALTAYETMSMGKPVVTSDVGGQAELVDGLVGRVVPLMQSEEKDLDSREYSEEEIGLYVKAITHLLEDRAAYAKTCAACRRRIVERFSAQIMIRRLEGIFEDLVQNSSRLMERRALSDTLNRLNHYVDDAFENYRHLEAKETEAEEIWNSREWFRNLYENTRVECDKSTFSPDIILTGDKEVERQLAEIYQMRSWKCIQRYRHFMDDTSLGKIISGIRDLFLSH